MSAADAGSRPAARAEVVRIELLATPALVCVIPRFARDEKLKGGVQAANPSFYSRNFRRCTSIHSG